LAIVAPSPVVELNRAVAVAEARGAAAALEIVDALARAGDLDALHHLHATRGELLRRLNRAAEARHELEEAARLARTTAERQLLVERLAEL
jgi:predicted RNA polymerase sigma factor